MPRIAFADFHNHSGTRTPEHPIPYVALDVVYLRYDARESYFVKPGDYWIARRDNRRILGSLERRRDLLDRVISDEWIARPVADAFRGDHFDDTGDILDEVPDYMSLSRTGHVGIGGYSTRDESAACLVEHLYRMSAPAVGFGPHWEVKRYESPLREPAKATRRTMAAGPFPTEHVRNEWGCDDHAVPVGARPLRFDNREKTS
jgi:hypothetical protein